MDKPQTTPEPINSVALNLEQQLRASVAENQRLRKALEVPEVWTDAERGGLARAWNDAREKHGHYETLFAVAAWLLRHRAEVARG